MKAQRVELFVCPMAAPNDTSGLQELAVRLRVDGNRESLRSGGGHRPREPGQLPQHRFNPATISRTSKSAAAMQLSAAP